MPVPLQEEVIEVVKPFPAERFSGCIIEQIVDLPVPHMQEQIMEVAEIIPPGRISGRCAGASDPEKGRRGGEGS